jgi:large subunit ribosomal protein L10
LARQDKVDKVSNIKFIFQSGRGLIFTDHSGIKAEDSVKMRNRLADIESYIKIIKNTLALIAANEVFENIDLAGILKGPTSIIVSGQNIVSTAKLVKEFSKQFESLKIKGGIFENKLYGSEGVERLASLPSREVLLTNLASMMQSPISNLVNLLSALPRNLVIVLDSIRAQKENLSN